MSQPQSRYLPILHIALLAAAVLAVYYQVFGAGFMSWDDADYVLQNNDIQSWGLKKWFSEFYIGNYHPLTMMSYAIDYIIGKQEPFQYHLTNIILHIANAGLLYAVVNTVQGNKWISFFVALLFAVHPVQTETVSWIAERKNVLYGFFFLGSMALYTRYLIEERWWLMLLVFIAGCAAMLSKAAAVSLPLSLLALDIWSHRPLKDKKPWLEKIPLFAVAIITGIIAINAQQKGAFLNLHPEYKWYHTVVFAGYAYVQYILHLFVPVKLSVLYPYPVLGALQVIYLVLAIGIVALGILAHKRNWYMLSGSILFYTVNIALVLQFVQFGEVLMADRYLYIACIGIWLPAVFYSVGWISKKAKPTVALTAWAVICLAFMASTASRNKIWLSEQTFWEAILETFPESSVAQSSVGGVYLKQGDYPHALEHINEAVRLDPGNYKAWYNKGVVHLRTRQYNEAAQALDKSIALNEYSKALFTRALLFQQMGQPLRALTDIEKVLEQEPQNARAHFIKGNCLEQNNSLEQALNSYSNAVQYGDGDPIFYLRRGITSVKLNRSNDAISDMSHILAQHPENAEAWYWRGIAKQQAGRECCHDLNRARNLGYKDAQFALMKYCNEGQ